jgi:hypothetical protein
VKSEMSKLDLEPGLYVNVFKVNTPDNVEVIAFTTSTRTWSDLRNLRFWIDQTGLKARVYRTGNLIIGYGQDAPQLTSKGFQQQRIYLFDHPKWVIKLINEGFSDHLVNKNYRMPPVKGRTTVYEKNPYRTAASGKIRVYRGYDLRAIYLGKHPQHIFGLIIDSSWEIHDSNGERLNTVQIRQYDAVNELAQIQEELLPNNQINPEVSRLRLRNQILPFVIQNKEFTLPLSEEINVSLDEAPIRIILGVRA